MEYQAFKEELFKETRKLFPDYDVKIDDEADLIIVKDPDKAVAPTLHIKDIYEKSQEVDRELMEALIYLVQEAMNNAPDLTPALQEIKDWGKIQDRLFIALRRNGTISERAIKYPLTENISCVVSARFEEGVVATMNETFIKEWGISKEEVIETAKANIKGENAGIITDMISKIRELKPDFIDDEELEDIVSIVKSAGAEDQQYIVSTKHGALGAAGIIQPAIIRELTRIFGDKFAIIPSSIHEVICLKYPVENANDMMREVNTEQVQDKDILGYNLIVYENGEFREEY